jgi:peptidoglycan/LPS O-acetylase OafA/YrhL
MKRSDNLQVLRGVAALLVFALHAMLIEQKVGRGVALIGPAGWIGSVAVDLFFALSGFIMVSITTGRFQNRAYAVRFWLERFFRVYPPYWAVSLPLLIVYLVKPGIVNASQGGQVNLLASFLLWPQTLLPLLSVGWTLVHEMYFYLVFTVAVAVLPERWRAHLLMVWALVVLVLGWGLSSPARPAWLALVLDPLTLDFIAGGLAALLLPRLQERGVWLARSLMVAGVLGFGLMLAVAPQTLDEIFLNRWQRVLVCAVPCSLLILGAVLSERPGQRPSTLKRLFMKIGDVSYSFYLIHLLVLSVAGKLWLAWGPATPVLAAVVYGLSLLMALALAHISHRWVEQPTLNLGRRWAAACERWLSSPSTPRIHRGQP